MTNAMTEVSVILTRRMRLVPMSGELMSAVLTEDWAGASDLVGNPIPEEWHQQQWDWLRKYAERAEKDPSSIAWGPRLLLCEVSDGSGLASGTVIGEAGFHGRPDAYGQVEIGYMVVSEYRRQGFAEEAAGGLVRWAETDSGVTELKAMVDPLNSPSINLLCKLGFAQAGREHHVERGEQLIFRRRASASS